MRVKPRIPGMIIRDPQTRQPLPDEGGDVAETSYWHRKLRDGDVLREDTPRPEREPIVPLATREEER